MNRISYLKFSNFVRKFLYFISIFTVLSSCTISLAPPYDPSMLVALNEANKRALVLFSSVSRGTNAGSFPAVAGQYDELIGTFDALRLQG
jgi:hypothetical protein